MMSRNADNAFDNTCRELDIPIQVDFILTPQNVVRFDVEAAVREQESGNGSMGPAPASMPPVAEAEPDPDFRPDHVPTY